MIEAMVGCRCQDGVFVSFRNGEYEKDGIS